MLDRDTIYGMMESWIQSIEYENLQKADALLGDDWQGYAVAQARHDGFNTSPKYDALAVANVVDDFTVNFMTKNKDISDDNKELLKRMAHRSDDMYHYVCGFLKKHEPQGSAFLYDRYATIMWGIIEELIEGKVGGFPENGWSAPSVGNRSSWKEFVLTYVCSAYDVDDARKHVKAYENMEKMYSLLPSSSK